MKIEYSYENKGVDHSIGGDQIETRTIDDDTPASEPICVEFPEIVIHILSKYSLALSYLLGCIGW